MASRPSDNVALVRRGYDAFNRGDIDAVLELCAPGLDVALLPDSPMAEAYHGHDGFRKVIAENSEMFDSYRNEPEEVIEVGEDKVVVVIRSEARGRLSGIELEGRLAHLWTLRDGKATRFEAFPSREAALAAARG